MAGTVLKSLSATPQADNTVMTSANSGVSSLVTTTGGAGVHLAAARMGGTAGYALTQTSTGTSFFYLDLDAAVTSASILLPMNYSAAPSTSLQFIRGYSDAAHTAVLFTLNFLTLNKWQFVENGGANVTANNALTPSTKDYVTEMFIDYANAQMSLNVYERGSLSKVATIGSTALTNSTGQSLRSWRIGLATASSIPQLYLNNTLAVGSGDFLPRSDVTTSTLSLTGAITPNPSDINVARTLTLNATGGNGNAISLDVDWGDGLAHDTGTMTTSAAKTFTRTPTVSGSKNAVITYNQA